MSSSARSPAVGSFTSLLLSRASRRLLLVAEAPIDPASAALAPSTRPGRRIREWLSATPADALTLCPRRWSMTLARITARSLWDAGALAEREVVLLGQKVARAFARLSPELHALVPATPFSMAAPPVPTAAGGWTWAMVWTVPHPSGRNRWWREPANRRAAELFFRYVAGRLEQPRWSPRSPNELARPALDVLAEELARSENHALDKGSTPG